MIIRFHILFLIVLFCFAGCNKEDDPGSDIRLVSVKIGNMNMADSTVHNAPVDQPVVVSFNTALDVNSVPGAVSLLENGADPVTYSLNFFNSDKAFSIYPELALQYYTEYTLAISGDLSSADGKQSIAPAEFSFRTIPGLLTLESLTSGETDLMAAGRITDIDPELEVLATFSDPVDPGSLSASTVS